MNREYVPAEPASLAAATAEEEQDRRSKPEHEGLGSHRWYHVPCAELLNAAHQSVVVINGDVPVESACETLILNGISSAPVWDKDKNLYAGMFDYRDVVTYVLVGLSKDTPIDASASMEFKELVRLARSHEPVPAKLAADISQRNPFYSVIEQTHLLQVAALFSSTIHRVAVMNDAGLRGIISQSTVIQYLYKNIEKFPDVQSVFAKSIKELGLGTKSVIAVDGTTSVLDALKLMSKNDVSSLAVLSVTGGIIANLSMSDIKWVLRSSKFNLLWQTCLQFVGFIDSEQGIMDGRDKLPVFDVLETSTLGYAVGKMIATKAHRVWVVERAAGPPLSVVTLTDVFKQITPVLDPRED
ncbi:cell separation during budding [Geranomyces variabilis]|uniref:Cell separation during budding n=1 Tax=Geranomyces variabilis TaxID=109894 RepID=A0AAD5TPP9_9FUNG|nr:cell separation during budding [Geranomyces variabilis]